MGGEAANLSSSTNGYAMTTTTHAPIDHPSLRTPPGPWSNAILVEPGKRYLFSCGLVGVSAEGVVPEGIEEQTRIIYRNITTLLQQAGMTMADVVKITTFMVDTNEQASYSAARRPFFEGVKPAMTLVQVAGLVNRDSRVEVEFIAAR